MKQTQPANRLFDPGANGETRILDGHPATSGVDPATSRFTRQGLTKGVGWI